MCLGQLVLDGDKLHLQLSDSRRQFLAVLASVRRSSHDGRNLPQSAKSPYSNLNFRERLRKLSDSEAEAAETQVWLQFAVECEYLDREPAKQFYSEYDDVISMIVHMISHSDNWIIK